MSTQVTIYNEYETQQANEAATEVYPDGIHAVLDDALSAEGYDTRTALWSEPENGLPQEVVDDTDVLLWWSHVEFAEGDVINRVADAVADGMGLIVLHSARRSRLFRNILGTGCDVRGYRDADETERVWVVNPGHPIADGLDSDYIEIPESQIVAEPFEVPQPDETVLISWLEGGEVFRSGCCWQIGRGRVFFFGPGHETHPVYHRDDIQQVLGNAVRWASPTDGPRGPQQPPTESMEPQEPLD